MERGLPGPKPYPGVIRGAGQCTRGNKMRENQKIFRNPIKRGLKIMRFYDDSWSSKLSHVKQSRTESAAVCVLNMDILFSMNWKNENASFTNAPVTFRGPGLAGTYDVRRKLACKRWTKELQQPRRDLRAMRRLYLRDEIMLYLFKKNSFGASGEKDAGQGCQQ